MTLTLTALEREQLLVLSELALALRTGDGASVRALLLDLDAATVDRLADRLLPPRRGGGESRSDSGLRPAPTARPARARRIA